MSEKNNSSYFIRLASYSSLIYKTVGTPEVSFITLASHGYSYLGHDLDIQCEGCKKTVTISEDWSNIFVKLKHLKGCVFESDLDEVNESSAIEQIHLEVDGVCDTQLIALNGNENSFVDYQVEQHSFSELNSNHHETYVQEDSSVSDDDEFETDSFSSSSLTQLHKGQKERHWSSSSSSLTSQSSGYCSDISAESAEPHNQQDFPTLLDFQPKDSNKLYDFSHFFKPENFELDASEDINNLVSQECEKNPGHFSYFALNSLKMEHLPSKYRSDEMYRLLRLMGELTVRIVVSATNKQQKMKDFRRVNQQKKRVGTGFVIEYPCQVKTHSESDESRMFNTFKKMLPFWRKNNNTWSVFIQTSQQLVFDNEDAQSAVVEFYYDSPDRKDVVILEGKHLLTSRTPGDNQCLLVCESSDPGFIHKINLSQQEFHRMAEKLPTRAKRGMLSKLFTVHHPHGGHKVLSYGDYVRVRYKFHPSEETNSSATLTKLTTQEQVDSDYLMYRKSLFYAADTCVGSCGAPVLTFSQRPTNANSVTLKVDVWIHCGVEVTHHLGVSILKAFTAADLIQASTGQIGNPKDDSDEENSLGKQHVTSPVYKVVSQVCHPEYALFQTRMDSFREWTHCHILEPLNLASSGFYYTGVADCVRCFHCSLGLRSWKPGDDVISQHEKYRPECPYIRSLIKGQETAIIGAVAEVFDSSSQSTESIKLKLLEAENRALKNQLVCKICGKSNVKDVFLPCGELYACSECSKLLTECPSCKKPIFATVTVYMM